MSALSNAKKYLAEQEQYAIHRAYYPDHPDVLLAELVAEIDAAPVGEMTGFEMGASNYFAKVAIAGPNPGSRTPGLGKTVRLLSLDSGGAGEVEK